MSCIKRNAIIRIICLATTLIAVMFLALYLNFNSIYQQCNGTIYVPNKKEESHNSESSLIKAVSSDTALISMVSSNNIILKSKTLSAPTSSLCILSSEIIYINTEESQSSSQTSTQIDDNTNNTTTSKEENLPTYPSSSTEISSPAASSTSSETSSLTSSLISSETSSEVVDDPLIKENVEKAVAISANYGVSITVASKKSDFSCEFISAYATNSQEIKNGLVEIESSLKTFPKEYFIKTSTDINVVLVSKTTTDNIITIGSDIIVPCFKTVSSSQINDFILSISVQKLSENVNLNYDNYNPKVFYYGYVQAKYNYSPSQSKSAYFITSEAQLSVEKDLSENFVAIFKNASTLQRIPNSSPYFKKLSYTFKMLVEWSDCFSEISVVKRFL